MRWCAGLRSPRCWLRLSLSWCVVVVVVMIGAAGRAGAAVSRIEVESIPAPVACWAALAEASASGGSGRTCSASGQALVFVLNVPAGSTGVLRLVALLDTFVRTVQVRIEGSTFTASTPSTSATSVYQTIFTSPVLGSGSHLVEVSRTAGGPYLDYFELTATDPPVTTTTTAVSSAVAVEALAVAKDDRDIAMLGFGLTAFIGFAWLALRAGRG